MVMQPRISWCVMSTSFGRASGRAHVGVPVGVSCLHSLMVQKRFCSYVIEVHTLCFEKPKPTQDDELS
jgi:hypothetical protein